MNVDTGDHEVLNVSDGTYSKREETTPDDDKICSMLYVKDKYSISNEAFHELSVISNLPNSSQVTKKAKLLNSHTEIRCAPNGIVGVQQSLRTHLKARLIKIIERCRNESIELPDTIRVKFTGDGILISRGLNVVLNEGQRACSVWKSHHCYSQSIRKL